MNYFSKNLKFLREKSNLDAQKVADDLNIPRSTFSCWENGLRTPKIEQIQEIANYFNVDIDIISRDYSINQEEKVIFIYSFYPYFPTTFNLLFLHIFTHFQ